MESLVHPQERVYFAACLAISLLVYIVLLVSFLLISFLPLTYIMVWGIAAVITQGLLIGYLKGNCIRVSERQFPEVHRLALQIADQMGLKPPPPIYVLQAGGLLNAFATRFFGRNFVVIYSDVLELAYGEGEDAVAFIIAHELAHIRRKHLIWRWILAPSGLVPLLATAYSRACEYTCDRFGARYGPDGAVSGLLVLAAGKRLYRRVNLEEFNHQIVSEGGFWVWLAELLSTHPHLSRRVRAVTRALTS